MRLIFLDPPPLTRLIASPTLWWSIVLALLAVTWLLDQ